MARKLKSKVAKVVEKIAEAIKPVEPAHVKEAVVRLTAANLNAALTKRWEMLLQEKKLTLDQIAERNPRLWLWAYGQGLHAEDAKFPAVARRVPMAALRFCRKALGGNLALQKELRLQQLNPANRRIK